MYSVGTFLTVKISIKFFLLFDLNDVKGGIFTPAKSYVTGLQKENIFPAGKNLTFFVQAVDQYNHNITVSNGTINAFLNNTPIQLLSDDQSLFYANLNFTSAVYNALYVCANGSVMIGESPFTINIVPADVDPLFCTVPQALGGTAGVWIRFTLTLRDRYNNLAYNAPANTSVEFRVQGPGQVQYNQTDVVNGQVILMWTGDYKASYLLSIRVQGTPITGSPFSASITDGTVDASNCVAQGPGISNQATVTKPNIFNVLLRDAYGNPVETLPSGFQLSFDGVGPDQMKLIFEYSWDNTKKQFEVSYNTQKSGIYVIYVRGNGTEIKNSPYSASVHADEKADAKTTTISKDELKDGILAGREGVFYVVTFDKFGNRMETNSSKIEVDIPSINPISPVVQYSGNGIYSVYWSSTTVASLMIVSVKVDGASVGQFTTNVFPNNLDPHKSILQGSGVFAANVGSNTSVTLVTRDSFNNTITSNMPVNVTISQIGDTYNRFPVTISPNNRGVVEICYLPTQSGFFAFSVQYQGKDVRQSPAILLVSSGFHGGVLVSVIIVSLAFIVLVLGIVYIYWIRYNSKHQYQILDDERISAD